MEVLIIVFAVAALIVGAIECFVGYKSIKELPWLMGFISGASLGVLIGFNLDNLLLGIILSFSIGIVTALAAFFFKSVGIMCISLLFGTVVGTVVFGHIVFGVLTGFICLLFTMFFYKPGSVIASSMFGASLIIFSARLIMNPQETSIGMFIIQSAIWIAVTLAGSTCQALTTFYDDFGQRNIIDTIRDYNESESFSEIRYPGYQRAYRNYCIKCGYDVSDLDGKCPRCGFDFDE